MCGIFAIIQPPATAVDVCDIKRACSLMRHRGPDQSGYALLNNRTVGFGHNRLSIQDPTAPPQPLVDPNTRTTIVLNGEVSVKMSLLEECPAHGIGRYMTTLKLGVV
jgi:asparagine synthase (glutamine-hydrolysing)